VERRGLKTTPVGQAQKPSGHKRGVPPSHQKDNRMVEGSPGNVLNLEVAHFAYAPRSVISQVLALRE
jgi:hypothetical protein